MVRHQRAVNDLLRAVPGRRVIGPRADDQVEVAITDVAEPARRKCKVARLISEFESGGNAAPARHIHPTTESDECDGQCNLPIGISRSHERRD